ncbi:MAG: M28 family metallopeptidase [Acidobacteriota bacterium]
MFLKTLTVLLSATLLFAGPANGLPRPMGFTADNSAQQLKIEEMFSSVPSPVSSRRHHLILTEEPHIEGQPSQRQVVEYVFKHFSGAGIPAELVEYQVYYPYPKEIRVQLLEPRELDFSLQEKGYELDKDTFAQDVIMPFNAYSPSGQAEGQVVYVNYGLPDDYERLRDLGVDVRDRIVLARYGGGFRGVKVKVAEEQGAAGILIYSDPMDDGYFQGDIYPFGPLRPPSGVQRGSVQYLFIHPGDPLTPGIAATQGATRIPEEQISNMPSIPSQPLSYEEARPILENLAGAVVPKGWQGALPFTYHVGPGPARIRMSLEMDYAVRPVWNVIGRISGSTYPNEWVVLGNHTDAWTYGAVDPNSGTTCLLELVSGLGELLQAGFRPKRTIILAAWGGEEYGLLGSTEWAEDLRAELTENAVAYLNVDSAVSGNTFAASAVPSLQDLVREVVRTVEDPATGKSVHEAWLADQQDNQQKDDQEPLADVKLGDLGSGSDYTVFLDHLGVPSLTMGFKGDYGVYHSLYDTHYWMTRFGDPIWQYHPVMTKIWGRMALRLANADVLPFDYSDYGQAIAGHLESLRMQSARIEEVNINWESLLQEAKAMDEIGREINQGIERMLDRNVNATAVARINELLRQVERNFLLEEGLPKRPWFKHAIYAPGYYTGYASKPLPGVSQALDDGEYTIAAFQAQLLLQQLRAANQTLDQIRRLTR